MSPELLMGLAAATILVAAVLAVLLLGALGGRRRLERALVESRAELTTLQQRLEELTARVDGAARTSPAPAPAERADFVITTAGEPTRQVPGNDAALPVQPLGAGRFTSVVVGESTVRLVSLAYGVRRALSAENRNRIAFEMRREVRRSRKQRRRDLKELRRRIRETPGVVGEDAA